jgi:histidine triad (HIT) family protein
MDDCLFCRIARGELPSFKLYEDDTFLCFLDINPVAKGHCLVIPKKHSVNLFDFDPASAPGYLEVIQGIAKRVASKLGAVDFNVVNASGKAAQQSVDHLHFHIVPRFPGDGIDMWFDRKKKWSMDELKALAEELS